MKLYNDNTSPYAARVRVQVYHKNLDVEILAPPGGPKSEEYAQINPLGLIPALDTGNEVISESLALFEYIEDRFPEPVMRPDSPEGRAAMRRIALYHDHAVQPALGRLFGLFMSNSRDRDEVAQASEALRAAFGKLQRIMGPGQHAWGEQLGIADCVLVPTAYYSRKLSELLDAPPPLTGHDRLVAWWEQIQKEDAAKRVLREIDTAIEPVIAANRPG